MNFVFANCRLVRIISRIFFPLAIAAATALAQSSPPESVAPAPVVSPSPAAEPSSESAPAANAATAPPLVPDPAEPTEASSVGNTVDPATLLPSLPSLPPHKTSLIGGTVDKLDRVRDELTLQVYGSGKMKIYFDPRTHVYRDGAEASITDLHRGDRVSIDTTLDGTNIFARTIRLKPTTAGESQGVVVSVRGDQLTLRDVLSPHPLKLRITSHTRLLDRGHSTSLSELVPGTLVTVSFGSQKNGHDVAEEVSVLAVPGASFTFAGQITSLDLSTGLLVLNSATDGKTYEIYLDPSMVATNDNLRPADNVTVSARFDGSRYVAQYLKTY